MSNYIYYEHLEDYENQTKKAKGFDAAYAALEELEVTIKCMRDAGYAKDDTNYYFATGKTSEFGVRAEILLDEIEKYKRMIMDMVGDK